MQPTYAMDDTQWSKLIQNVAYYFDDLTLKRGFQYYKTKSSAAVYHDGAS